MGSLDFIGNIVTGGFDFVGRIAGGIGEGMTDFGSSFFPAPQRQTPITISQQTPVVNLGKSYRPTAPEMPSAIETAAQAARDWLDSPYEAQYGPSQVMLASIDDPNPSPIDVLFGHIGEIGSQIGDQLPDLLLRKWGILPEPQPQNSQGDIIYQVYPDPNLPQPATQPATQAGQPKGTYDLGFLTDWLKIPAATIPTPTAAQVKTVAGISVKTIALIGVGAIIFFGLKKL